MSLKPPANPNTPNVTTLFRVDAEAGPQYSTDGGTTWTDIQTANGAISATSYGVEADRVTRGDAVMTNGSAALTSAGANFTSSDVGKVVVVNNAKGVGTHLYGTIDSFQSATQVTLSTAASRTVSNVPFTYGTDDTTALQAAIDAAVTSGKGLLLPPTGCCTTAALTVSGACDIRGQSMVCLFGPNIPTGASDGDLAGQTYPITAPYLNGSVIAVCAANVNAFTLAVDGDTVNFHDVGIYFAGQWDNTGHGIQVTAAALAAPATGGYNNGLQNSRWDNVAVYGHDGSHYAFHVLNCLELTGTLWHSFGGGGVHWEANSSISYYGACSVDHMHVCLITGPAHGMLMSGLNGSLISNIVMTDYVCVNAISVHTDPTRFTGWSMAATGNSFTYTGLAANVSFIGADVETGEPVMPQPWFVSPDSYWPSIYLNGDDTLTMMKVDKRRFNRDMSKSLDSAEAADSEWWLLNDVPERVRWSLTTDGTRRMHIPGTVRATGPAITAARGAALGTSPPPVVAVGADLAGQVIFGSGTGPATGVVATFTFAKTQATAPTVVLTPTKAAAEALGLYVSATSTTGFSVSVASAPAASQAVSTYGFTYHCIDAGGAPPVPVVYDDFDKSDSAVSLGSPQIGPAPTTNGTWGISSNQAYMATAGTGQQVALWDAGVADGTVQAYIGNPSGFMGIAFRAASLDDYLYVATGSGTVAIWHVTNARTASPTYTQIGAAFDVFGATNTLKVVLSGTSITIKYDSETIYSTTSSVNQTATKHGLTNNGNTNSRWDNFQVF